VSKLWRRQSQYRRKKGRKARNEPSSANDRVVFAVLSINSLNTGLGDLLDTSRNESDVVLNEGFEVARTGGEAAAADSEGRDEGLGDLGTGGKLGLHWKSGRGR
jgi:hypothetical protein